MGTPTPKLNSLQIEAMQTQVFPAAKKPTFNAVMTVLQNEGYTIKTADYDTGFITGKSPTKSGFGFDGSTHTSILATAFVTPVKQNNKTASQIRLSFVENQEVTHNGTYTNSTQILDPEVYKKAFSNIRQQVFVAGSVTSS